MNILFNIKINKLFNIMDYFNYVNIDDNLSSKRIICVPKYKNRNYNFVDVLNIELILNQIFQFMNIKDKKFLSLCNKKINKY